MASIENIISYMANIHGVAVSKDDPILMAYSLNQKLADENKENQQLLLQDFESKMKDFNDKWSEDVLEKAARILNAAVVANKTAIDNQVKQSVGEQVFALANAVKSSEIKADIYLTRLNSVMWINVVCVAINLAIAALIVLR